MKKNLFITCMLGLFLAGTSCEKFIKNQIIESDSKANLKLAVNSSLSYNWDNVSIGGGGYVTGIVIHPTTANRMYIRTDVGGAYRWDNSNLRWVQILDAISSKVDGIALDANAPDRVYTATNAGLYKSDDLGSSWTKLSGFPGTFDGNGNLRWVGEPIAVDPATSAYLYVGSRSNGLYKSSNTGSSFSQALGVPTNANVRSVVIDPTTLTGGHSIKIYASVPGIGVYRSIDGGTSFSLMSGTPINPNRLLISNGKLYVTHSTGLKVWNGSLWSDISPPGAVGTNLDGIAIESFDPMKIAVAQRSSTFNNKIFRSTNGGSSWEQVNSTALPITKAVEVPWWPNQWFSSATSCLIFDPLHHGDLYYTDWFGIWYTGNLWQTGSVDFSTREKGHEETVVLTILVPPAGAGTALYSGMADVGGFRTTSYSTYPLKKLSDDEQITHIAYCETSPANIAVLVTDDNNGDVMNLKTSSNSGDTWTTRTLPSGKRHGRIAISATNPDMMVYVAGGISGTVYYSVNRGSSWTASTGSPTGAVATPDDIYCKDFALAADAVDDNKFYVFKSGFLYKSTNGGATWAAANSTAIPTKNSFLFVVARPGVNGEVWVSLDGNGLYKTTNSGSTFTKISSLTISKAFSIGAPASVGGIPAIYIYGTVGSVLGLYRSLDLGSSWDKIDGAEKFSAGVKSLAADRSVFGRIYVATGGRGIMYGTP